MSTNIEEDARNAHLYSEARNRLHHLEIVHARERVDVASREYHDFKNNSDNPHGADKLESLLSAAKKNLESLAAKYEAERVEDFDAYREKYSNTVFERARIAKIMQHHSSRQSMPEWNVFDGPYAPGMHPE